MKFSTSLIDDALAPARAFGDLDVRELTRPDLLAAHHAVAAVRRASDVLLAALSGEIAARSAGELGAGGLARAQGFSTPQRLIAQATGGSLADAHRLVQAGAALLERDPLIEPDHMAARGGDAEASGVQASADVGPPTSIGEALARGDISVEAAALMRSTLSLIDDADGAVESRLVRAAREMSLQDLRRVCLRAQASYDARAWRDREVRQYQARCATLTEAPDGMVVLTARLDPPSALPLKAWLDAQVRDAFMRRREDAGASVGAAGHPGAWASSSGMDSVQDDRTAGQIRADALVALARHGLGCEQPTSGVTTTVVVRIGLDELRSGLGLADGDDISTPLSAEAVRCLAADAELIPLILGGQGEVLDLGRSRRLFSRAQRLALVERDGGCAWCHSPPSFCEAHHIRWWDRDEGRTDLKNGVLLCTSCHHRLHQTGWDVVVRDGCVWFVPPANVDPQHVPRLGGRARLEGTRVPEPRTEIEPEIGERESVWRESDRYVPEWAFADA